MTIQEDLFEVPKMIKVSPGLHQELSILKAKLNLPRIESVIEYLLEKTREDGKIQNSDR